MLTVAGACACRSVSYFLRRNHLLSSGPSAPLARYAYTRNDKLRRNCSASRRNSTAHLCKCQAAGSQALEGNAVLHSSTTSRKAAAKQRHALFNDYNLSIPWGIVNGAAGLISLPFKGGWSGVLVSIAGFLLFTLGSMNHHTTSEGSGATWAPTLGCAAIAAFLAQRFYQKAIAGVAGTMIMTIASAVISLGLVYNVVAGGNKPPAVTAPKTPSISSDSNPEEQPSAMRGLNTDNASTGPFAHQARHSQQEASSSIQQEGRVQDAVQGASSLPWGLNAFTMAAVTGSVLYAQGLWGLWGETVGYSPAGLAAAAVAGLATLGAARLLLQQPPSE